MSRRCVALASRETEAHVPGRLGQLPWVQSDGGRRDRRKVSKPLEGCAGAGRGLAEAGLQGAAPLSFLPGAASSNRGS